MAKITKIKEVNQTGEHWILYELECNYGPTKLIITYPVL